MYQCDESDSDSDTLQLNSELQQAQAELLNAHFATHQLRLRYSSDQLVRFGRAELLRKSAEAATELHHFYSSIERKLPATAALPVEPPSPEQVAQAIQWMVQYLEEQRETYVPIAARLPRDLKARLRRYFSAEVLEQVGFVELHGARVAVPAFFVQARALGFEPPAITHMDSLTFVDVIVFNEELSERALFHALVHSVQIRALGLRRYAELWVHSFIRTRAHFTVPLEVHAFSLASKFLRPGEAFSVEDQVARWIADNRY